MAPRSKQEALVKLGLSIVELRPATTGYKEALALSKRHQATLGPLPFAAFEGIADAGGMLGAMIETVEGEALAGYVLSARRRDAVTITHLCVDQAHQHKGVAKALVDAVATRHQRAPGIRLRCRNDYGAHQAWPALGFVNRGERPGRSKAGHKLTDWWRPIHERSLLTFHPTDGGKLSVALDTCVFRDIAEPRPDHAESLALEDDWIDDSIELLVTGELRNEVGRTEETRHLAAKATRYREVAVAPEEWEPIFETLSATLGSPTIEVGDRRLLAQAAAGGAERVVTRDEDVLSHAEAIEELTGLVVSRPVDLLVHVHSLGNEQVYQPRFLSDPTLRVVQLNMLPQRDTLGRFCHHEFGEPARSLEERIRSALVRPNLGGSLATLIAGDDLQALAASYRNKNSLEVTALRHLKSERGYTLFRQLVHSLRQRVAAAGGGQIVVADHVGSTSAQALTDEGFTLEGAVWSADVHCTVMTGTGEVAPELGLGPGAAISARAVDRYERRYWPSKLVSGEIPTFIVPIRLGFAQELLALDDPQQRLFSASPQVALAREHVYFRSPTAAVAGPARILWWVSGGGATGGMRACSWLDDVDTDRPRTLHRKYGKRGVLDEAQIATVARPSRHGYPVATALRFSRTELFSAPIPKPQAESLYPPLSQSGFLQSTRRVSEHVFDAFYRWDHAAN